MWLSAARCPAAAILATALAVTGCQAASVPPSARTSAAMTTPAATSPAATSPVSTHPTSAGASAPGTATSPAGPAAGATGSIPPPPTATPPLESVTPTVPPTTAVTPTTSAAAAVSGPVVTGKGTGFVKPKTSAVRGASASMGTRCYGLLDAGWSVHGCLMLTSAARTSVAVTETKGTAERDLVWTLSGGALHLVLTRSRTLPTDAGGGQFNSDITLVQLSDLAGDGAQKLIFYTPQSSTTFDSFSAIDVVESNGTVSLHRALAGGVASRATGGGLQTWVPSTGGRFVQSNFGYARGAWHRTGMQTVAASAVPTLSGQF